VVELLTFYKP